MYDPKHFKILLNKIDEVRTGRNAKQALAFLTGNATPFLTKKVAECKSTTERRLWEQSHNLVTSYVDGIKSGDATVADLRELITDLKSAELAYDERMLKVSNALRKKEKAKADFESEVGSASQSSASDNGEVAAPFTIEMPRQGFDHGTGAKDVFDKYEKWKAKIPEHSKKAFVGIRVPILVISKGIPDQFKLRRTGLCDDLLFGYPILKGQILIGMNFEWLKEGFSKGTKILKKDIDPNGLVFDDSTIKFVDHDIDYSAASEFVIKELKQKTGRSYLQMGGPHGYGKLSWIWLASSSELNRLNGTTSSGSFTVKDWTFPFENETRKFKNTIPS